MKNSYKGPVEDLKWTDTLKANVVTPGSRPRVHGYDVRGQMLGSSSFPELIFLALTGDLPTEKALSAFESVLLFAAPVSAEEAPVHASILSGLCGSGQSGLTGVSAISLAQRARWLVSKYSNVLEALSREKVLPDDPDVYGTEEEKQDTALLLDSLRNSDIDFPPLLSELKPAAASLAVLYFCCELTDPGVLEAVLVLAALPCTLAEGRAVKPGNFRTYPIDLPEFRYTDD